MKMKVFNSKVNQYILLCIFYLLPSLSISATLLKYFQPDSEILALNHQENHHVEKGFCREPSDLIHRVDAVRCYVNQHIYDPCFIHPHKENNTALCVDTPWSKHQINIQLTSSIRADKSVNLDMSKDFPWAVILSKNNLKCDAYHDKNKLIDGMSVRYRCEDTSLLVGSLQRCDPNWSILRYVSGSFHHEEIKVAWF
tara:strand:- start:633 stop:1223 length:591 start_codon:yes stop_codon:yes gene_type:complete